MTGIHHRLKRLCAALLGLTMAAASVFAAVGGVSAEEDSTPFAQRMDALYQTPEMEYKPETRWWLAEGSHTDETLLESIQELYDAGFGAVEFVTLDESEYLEDERYAWGSEEWIHDSHLIVKRCTELGMGVSFTSGTNWASANLVSITPDDEAAAQQLGYRSLDLPAGERYQGPLPMPELPEKVTKMRLERVISVRKSQSQAENTTLLVPDSFTDITDSAVREEDGSWSVDYVAPSGEDSVLLAFWQYGTGETSKPAVSDAFTINYFSRKGADALIEYWNENVLDDSLKEMILENGDVSMYMDSLEMQPKGADSTGNFWSADFLREFQERRGYDLSPYLPVIILSSYGPFAKEFEYAFGIEGQETLCEKIRNDLYQTNTELYMEECLDVLTEWLHTFGMTLRAENSYGEFLCYSQPVKSLDWVETESWEFHSEIDEFRNQAGAAHLYGKTYSSETGAIVGQNYQHNNDYFRQIFYTQFASGVQRTVLHGYSSAYGPDENTSWPGYEGMGQSIAERFNKRQPAFDGYPELNAHLARLQKVLRQGSVKMDVGILRTDYALNNTWWLNTDSYDDNYLRRNEGLHWKDTSLQNAGYTYDYFSPVLLQDSDITCNNGQVQADGVGYQALIAYQDSMPYESAEVLYGWAKSGLPVVLVDGPTEDLVRCFVNDRNESAALFTTYNDGNDEEMLAILDKLRALDNVAVIYSQDEADDALLELGVQPRAAYTEPNSNLLSVVRQAEDASYLYLYNYMYTDEENYTGKVSVEGIFKPYLLNTWSGETCELAEYDYQDGRTILNVDLAPGDVMVFALDPSTQTGASVVSKNNADRVTVEDGKVTMYVAQSGTAELSFSDGTSYRADVSAPENIELKDWSLVVEDWQPGEKITRTEDRNLGYTTSVVTFATDKKIIDVGKTELVPWKEIAQVGSAVSGTGSYSTSFSLPDNWNQETNAVVFQVNSLGGGTASVKINGETADVNLDSGTADLSRFTHPGVNTLEVTVTTSLLNRMLALEYSFWKNASPDDYGMTGTATLVTYTKVSVAASDTDKTILSRVLAYAEAQYADSSFQDVILEVQTSFTEALKHARSVNAEIGASQEDIDSAWQRLMTEIHKLGFVCGDKTALGRLIELSDQFYCQIDLYTPVTAEPFKTELSSAKETFNSANALQQDVAEAESSLLNAMMALRYRADKSVLHAVLTKASGIDLTAYTAQSVALLHEASAAAKAARDDLNAIQAEVDDAAGNLNAAIDGLVGQSASAGSTAAGDTALSIRSGNARTGETAPAALAISLLALAGISLAASKKKKLK